MGLLGQTDTMGYDNSPIENQDFPGWVLTTSDGTQYNITRGSPNYVTIPDPNSSGDNIVARVYGPPALTKIVEGLGRPNCNQFKQHCPLCPQWHQYLYGDLQPGRPGAHYRHLRSQ